MESENVDSSTIKGLASSSADHFLTWIRGTSKPTQFARDSCSTGTEISMEVEISEILLFIGKQILHEFPHIFCPSFHLRLAIVDLLCKGLDISR